LILLPILPPEIIIFFGWVGMAIIVRVILVRIERRGS